MKLRDYQKEAIDAVIENFKDGNNKILISLATGLGKTVIFTTMSRDHFLKNGKKVLVLAHRKELLHQAREKFLLVDPSLKVMIEQGQNTIDQKDYKHCDVICASISTLGRKGSNRINKYNPNDFSAVIVDEAHHALAKSYIRVFEYFGISKHPPLEETLEKTGKDNKKAASQWANRNKHILLFGCTATPMRSNNSETLRDVFDILAYKYDLIEGIKNGYLSNVKTLAAHTATTIGKVKTVRGDYQSSELTKFVNTESRNKFIVQTYKEEAQKGPSIVFTVGKEHNDDLAEMFKKNNIVCEVIDGSTPKVERELIIKDFKIGRIPVLINCAVLTEGFDVPSIRNVIMARPTKSPIFYMQAIGRGTRLDEGKEYVTVIDFVDNFRNHDPLSFSYIVGIPDSTSEQDKGTEKNKKIIEDVKGELEDLEEIGSGKLGQLSLGKTGSINYEIIDHGLLSSVTEYIKSSFIKDSEFTWFKIFEDTWFLSFPNYTNFVTKNGDIKFLRSRLKVQKSWEQWDLHFEGVKMDKSKVAGCIGKYSTIRELDARVSGFIIQNNIQDMFLKKGQRWHKDLCSEKQREFIMNLLNHYKGEREINLDIDDIKTLTKGDAGILINLLRYETKT